MWSGPQASPQCGSLLWLPKARLYLIARRGVGTARGPVGSMLYHEQEVYKSRFCKSDEVIYPTTSQREGQGQRAFRDPLVYLPACPAPAHSGRNRQERLNGFAQHHSWPQCSNFLKRRLKTFPTYRWGTGRGGRQPALGRKVVGSQAKPPDTRPFPLGLVASTHRTSSSAGQSTRLAARGLAAWLSISQETRLGTNKRTG